MFMFGYVWLCFKLLNPHWSEYKLNAIFKLLPTVNLSVSLSYGNIFKNSYYLLSQKVAEKIWGFELNGKYNFSDKKRHKFKFAFNFLK